MTENKVFIASALVSLVVTVGYFVLSPTDRPSPYSSVVSVTNFEGTSGGTGWVTRTLKGTKVIVTNEHVCAIAQGSLMRINDETGKASLKRIVKHSPDRDLCLVEGIDAPALKLANKGPVRFDTIFVLGHPLLKPLAPAQGVYTGDDLIPLPKEPLPSGDCNQGDKKVDTFFGSYCVQTMELSLSTVQIFPGNSGSAVTNSDGDVIGVMNSAATEDHMGMFIPLVYVRELLAD